ncbi:hypothetical protein WN55_05909 [Dufourea novaeangliae]|uniref:DUF4817 domain-containing protein n=1 Tax=Dufourea novaeangliae TaxID=178035 RepID=A0A154PN69_DUFNO|nr:hypothetical protein WN55_05909 [Dufourea novaeangliae]
MVFVYGKCRQIVRDVIRLYVERFPERVTPSRSAFTNVIKSFQEPARVDNKIRRRSKAASILRILHLNKFHAFHVSLHQALHGNDFQNRVNFCEWGLQKFQSDEMFLTKVLFTDEATFTNCGQVNRHNMHYWSIENPRWLREMDKQRPWSVNVWCGVLNGEIIGPYFIDGTLNTSRYKHILTKILRHLLKNIPLHIRQTMWFQQDGCPAHSAWIITQFLNVTFGDRWIGCAGNHKWPARSPDLTPLNFYLWGKLKQQVYNKIPTTKEDMKEAIRRACAAINPTEIQHAVLPVKINKSTALDHFLKVNYFPSQLA